MREFLLQPIPFSRVIVLFVAAAMVAGAIDYFRGNRWGLGEKFLGGFQAFPALTLNMLGIIVLTPLLSRACVWVAPLYGWIGADPAIFAGTVLANDNGGFQLAHALALTPAAGDFGGMIIGALLGVNIAFTIPVGLGMVNKADRPWAARGILYGLAAVPLGGLVGGLVAGYAPGFLLRQLVPTVIVAAAIILLLRCLPEHTVRGLIVLGRCIEFLALAGTAAAFFTALTGWTVIPGLGSAREGFEPVIAVILMLPGAYVLAEMLARAMRQVLPGIARRLGVTDIAVVGLITTLASSLPTFAMTKDMNRKGKVLNFAFLTGAAFLLGDHLGFCSAVAPHLVTPLLAAKAAAGLGGILLALLIDRSHPGPTPAVTAPAPNQP